MVLWLLSALAAAPGWPDLSSPDRVGGGEADAALVIGIEDYWAVPDVLGARQNARDWYTWLTRGHGVPTENVQLILDQEATAEQIREQATRLAGQVGPDGRMWVVFIGHGAPAKDGNDALMLGADVQQTAQSVYARGVTRSDLLEAIGGAKPVLVLDSCFSGQTGGGEALVPGLQPLIPSYAEAVGGTTLTAGSPDQFAGPLPGAGRPAFSYLVLGALQGWGDGDGDGTVTAKEAVTYANSALSTTVVDRTQQPRLAGSDAPLAKAGKSTPPDLEAIVLSRSQRGDPVTLVVPDLNMDVERSGVDPNLERLYAATLEVNDNPYSTPYETAKAWCKLEKYGKGEHHYAELASSGCDEWTTFAETQADAYNRLEKDYENVRSVLAIEHVSIMDKVDTIDAFLMVFGSMDDWHVEKVRGVRDRVADGQSVRLPAYREPEPWTLKPQEDHGAFYWTWERAVLDTGSSGLRAGLAFSTGGSVGGTGMLYGATFGPVDVTALGATFSGDEGYTGVNVRAGFAPFTIRPSERTPGEPRGSFVNPIVGLGYGAGTVNRLSDDTTTVKAKFIDGYVANHFFVTNAVGFRLEYAHPLVTLGEDAPDVSGVPGTLGLSFMFMPLGGLW